MENIEELKVENQTTVTSFILLGFSHLAKLQLLLFVVTLLMFLVTMMGNFLIIAITIIYPVLHTPMYYFLKNLALIEICYSLCIVPRMLVNLLVGRKAISFSACALQLNGVILFVTSECFLLGAMAYDRHVAICHPLHYATIMSKRLCIQIVTGCWLSGVSMAVGFTSWLFSFPFCGSKEINHFFCDVSPVLKLVCADTSLFELVIVIDIVIIVMVPFFFISVSYIHIIYAILQIPSPEGRHKAFSTCAAHLVVVTLFYSTAGIIHLRPKSNLSSNSKKLVSLSYTVVTPMLNPIIYSLRNKEVKESLRRLFGLGMFMERPSILPLAR
ncbi:olfactory receptor 10A7-like [Alligator mississippiensis]|uniref:olfactory receptor 10A7-like n=1 Tax=Alligator mississippiensis TaxID=8496 RepID=UPI0028774568|nr:olfactory receptor 10A7-like [Alligator mississippiensis]